jgi:hypothetical protein
VDPTHTLTHPTNPPHPQQKVTLLQSQLSQLLRRAETAERHRTSLEQEHDALTKQLAEAVSAGGSGGSGGSGVVPYELKIATLQVRLCMHVYGCVYMYV